MPETLRSHDPRQLGHYRIVARLGEGGQGTVFLGHSADGQRVAIKLLRAEMGDDKTSRRRFVREIQTAQRVPSMFTARVLDADVAGHRPYIVSEYLDAPTLHTLVDQGGPLQGDGLQRFVFGTAAALAAIHAAGVVHRDFKPGNVLMTPDGPRVIDFGIARALDSTRTLTSSVVGTPAYMAPEQFSGPDEAHNEYAADVFAWAATIAFAANGRPPFGTDDFAQILHRILYLPPDLGGIQGGLRELLTACMAKDPNARPTSRELAERLRVNAAMLAPVTGDPGTTMPTGGRRDNGRPARRSGHRPARGRSGRRGSKRLLLASLSSLLLVGVSIAGYLVFNRTSGNASEGEQPQAKKHNRIVRPQPGLLPGTKARIASEMDDGISLVSYSYGPENKTTRRIWMLPDGEDGRFQTTEFFNAIDYIDASPSGRWLAVARDPDDKGADGKVLVIDRTGVTTPLKIPAPTDDNPKTTGFLYAPDWDRSGEELMINVGEQRKGEEGTFLDGLEFSTPFTTGGVRRFQELGHQTYEWRPKREGFIANDEDNERADGNRPDVVFYTWKSKKEFTLESAGWLATDGLGSMSPSGSKLVTHCGGIDLPKACVWDVKKKSLVKQLEIDDPNPITPGSGTLGWYDEGHILTVKNQPNGRQDVVVMNLAGTVTKTLLENTADISYTLAPSKY